MTISSDFLVGDAGVVQYYERGSLNSSTTADTTGGGIHGGVFHLETFECELLNAHHAHGLESLFQSHQLMELKRISEFHVRRLPPDYSTIHKVVHEDLKGCICLCDFGNLAQRECWRFATHVLSRQGLAAAMIVHNLDAVGEMLVSADDIPVFTLPSQILAEMSKYSFALASFQRHEYSRYSTGTLEPRQMDETVATRVIQDWWRRMPSMEQSAVLDAPDTVESSFREDEAAAAIQVWWRQRLVEREVLYYEEYDSDSIDSYWSR